MVLNACGCGDPRFPVPPGSKHCRAADSNARKCLDDQLGELGGHHGSVQCRCESNKNNVVLEFVDLLKKTDSKKITAIKKYQKLQKLTTKNPSLRPTIL